MSRKGNQTNQQISKGLTYVAQQPSFLRNFGKPLSPPPKPGRGGVVREGREAVPSRPKEGQWAREGSGSGSESEDEFGRRRPKGKGREEGEDVEPEEEDEWGEVYGGGGDDGPQVVVLKEGRHLSAHQVKQERRRGMYIYLEH